MPLDISSLPKEYPRHFVPIELDPGDWSQLKIVFEELSNRDISKAEDLECWLLDWSELMSVIDNEGDARYIRMTSQTDNKEFEEAYLDFVENFQPQVKRAGSRLQMLYVNSPARKEIPNDRYGVLDRKISNQVAIFREENVALETAEAKLSQQYQKITGAMTVELEGKELTLSQAAAYLEKTDRRMRQHAWEMITERFLKDRLILEQIFNEMISVRQQIAHNAGFDNYRDYSFRRLERFDYSPEDCLLFQDSVEKHIVPLMRQLDVRQRKMMGLEELRPWDLQADPLGRPPLHPFDSVDELLSKCEAIIKRVDDKFAIEYSRMVKLNLLDLESRIGKAPGGYQSSLFEHRLPFIFMNAVGRQLDVVVLLHELGHAFHTFAVRDEPLYSYRQYPKEFAEVASMTMELFGAKYWEEFYPQDEADRARRDHLDNMAVRLLPWIATIDAFQHWVYTHPNHSDQQRADAWVAIRRRFGGLANWDGYEEAERFRWHRQLHPFLAPFYYIEYGIARLGALGIWARSREDYRSAVNAYKQALSLGGSRPLPELFEAAGIQFAFGDEILFEIAGTLRSELLHDE